MFPSLQTTAQAGMVLALLGAGTTAALAAESKIEPPRYRLRVGQEVSYRGSSTFQHKSGQFHDRASWRFWVLRTNADGSCRLLLRSGSAFSQSRSTASADNSLSGVLSKLVESFVPQEPPAAPETVTFAYCDLFPDGKIPDNSTLGFQMRPSHVLPLLPKDEAEARKGWIGRDRRMDETTRYRMLSGLQDGDRCQIEAIHESRMDEIYGFAHKDVLTFDRKRGLPEKLEAEHKQTYGFQGQGRGTMKLEEVKVCAADWCKQLAADADCYFAAKEVYRKASDVRGRQKAELKAALKAAVARLKTARAQVQLPVLQKALDEDLGRHEQLAKYYLEEADRQAEILGRPAADWSTTDLEGKAHALKDYRGKVVVLDFWYRGCGWCIRAMPQVKEVAAHFKDRPVVVFGMNTDRKLEDAKLVVEKMGLPYANLKAEGLPERYKVQGFPTLIILDRESIVRDIHVGYSPTLKEEVIRSVERLLR